MQVANATLARSPTSTPAPTAGKGMSKGKDHNGKEGVLGKWEEDAGIWVFTSGTTSTIKVREVNI